MRSSGRPGAGSVVGHALFERLLTRGDDVGRRVEVGLANFEVDHRPTLGFEGASANEHFEGGLLTDVAHPLGGRDCHGP